MQKLIKAKTSVGIAVLYRYGSLRKTTHLETVATVKRLSKFSMFFLELEKSDAPFKETILSYTYLLQRGVRRFSLRTASERWILTWVFQMLNVHVSLSAIT